jgi:[acyl-carrier-protein] S-malonyltransferase
MDKDKKYALIFPGQGSQGVGMGKAISESSPAAKSIFDEANEVLGFDLARLCFEGPEEELTLTKNSQPAIFVTSIACLKAFEEQAPSGLSPCAAAGLSLGEFSAHVAAGSLSFADGVRLVRKRGEAMQAACDVTPSTMASIIGLDETVVRSICEELGRRGVIGIANLNCPGQIAVSGETELVRTAMGEAEKRGAQKAVELQVSGAFHSQLMKPAEQQLSAALAATELHTPRFPIIANVNAQPVTTPEEIRRTLVQQLCSPVLWEKSMQSLIGGGVGFFLEMGHNRVLRGLMRRIDKSQKVLNVGDPASLNKTMEQLTAEPAVQKAIS